MNGKKIISHHFSDVNVIHPLFHITIDKNGAPRAKTFGPAG